MAGFNFKRFSIAQDNVAMKVSTDGILLGAWADVSQARRILDVGTGTGLLALMAKQRAPDACVHGIDIEPDACTQAQLNVAASPWPEVAISRCDANTFTPEQAVDLVISNPPYFDNALKAGSDKRTLARHTDSLPFSELLGVWQRASHSQTELAVILPLSGAEQLHQLVLQQGGYLRRCCRVKTTTTKAVTRCLMQWSWQPSDCHYSELVIHQGDDYSGEYRTLCKDFYLRF